MSNLLVREPPGPGAMATLRMMPGLVRDPLGTMISVPATHGDIVRMKLGPTLLYLLTHPDHAKYVLQDNYTNYRKSSIYHEFSVLLGDGQLTTNDMDYWRRQRKLIHPPFSRSNVERFAEQIAQSADSMLQRWEPFADSQQPLDIYADFMELLLSITGKILFSIDLGRESPQVAEAMQVAFDFIMKRVNAPVKLPRDFPTPSRRRVARHVGKLDGIVLRLIEERRRDNVDRGDLLSSLIMARDEAGQGMSDDNVRDEIKTLLVAGHESPANALSWACYLLSLNPDKEELLATEVAEVLGDRRPAFADLPNLPYTRMVLEEAMRLYPPAWVVEREPLADDEIAGHRIKAGARVTMFMYQIHRHPDFWDDPEAFEPARFAPDNGNARHRYAFFPFSGGPRVCLGRDLSMVEMVLTLAMVMQRFTFRLDPTHPVVPLPSVNLRPQHGIRMRLERR